MTDVSLDTGIVRLSVTVDGENGRAITFNPHDVVFVEKIHKLYFDLKAKHTEYQAAKEAIQNLEKDADGMLIDIAGISAPVREINTWFRSQIDGLLGDGTCQGIFGDVMFADEKLGVYFQLLDAVISHTAPVRAEKVAKYLPVDKKKPRKPRKR